MDVRPYLFFYGNCEQALAFYTDKLGAEVSAKLRYKDAPGDQTPGEQGERIMHALFRIGDATLMASDDNAPAPATPHSGFRISIALDKADKAKAAFDALADGGSIALPWQPTFFSKGFGMVTDKFGIPWMVSVTKDPAQ